MGGEKGTVHRRERERTMSTRVNWEAYTNKGNKSSICAGIQELKSLCVFYLYISTVLIYLNTNVYVSCRFSSRNEKVCKGERERKKGLEFPFFIVVFVVFASYPCTPRLALIKKMFSRWKFHCVFFLLL